LKPGCLDHLITVWDERKGRMVTRKLNKTEKYHLVGNSVPPYMVQMLAEDNVRRELVLEAAE
jgi:DNA (cytosine-5)-methyltransferase 1